MKNILQINQPKNSSHFLWEHILGSTVWFVGTYATLFFGPLILSSRKHSHYSDSDLGLSFMTFMLEHPEIQIGISTIVAFIYNIFIVKKKQKKEYIFRIDIENNNAYFRVSNLYYKNTQQVVVPLKNIEFELQLKTSTQGEKDSKIVFLETGKNKIIGKLLPDQYLWIKQKRHIMQALSELVKLGVAKKVSKNNYNSLLLAFFKR